MKIAYCSDLHLEFGDFPDISNAAPADVLILAGDCFISDDLSRHPALDSRPVTGTSGRLTRALAYAEFLSQCTAKFSRVLMVAGNHEHYGNRLCKSHNTLRDLSCVDSRIIFLNRESIVIDGVRFLGTTLWVDFDKGNPLTMYDARQNMNDFKKITIKDGETYRKITPGDAHRIHLEDRRWIFETARNSIEPCVVITHHAPSFESIPEQFWRSSINGAYASELSYDILDAPNIKGWVHGHVHSEKTYQIGDTTVYCNPRGYVHYGEGIDWEMRYFTI